MTGEVAAWKMQEHQAESLHDLLDRKLFYCILVSELIGSIHKCKIVRAGRFRDLAHLLLANDHHCSHAGCMSEIENIGAECISVFRYIFIPTYNVFRGACPHQHG